MKAGFINEYRSNAVVIPSKTLTSNLVEKNNISRKSLRMKWSKIKVSLRNYVDKQLGDSEIRGFFAAGICPFLVVRNPKTGKDELSVLLVREARSKRKTVKLNFLGGKREKGENPNETAYREFLEETGGILVESQKRRLWWQLRSNQCQVFWLSEGRYILKGISSPKGWIKLPRKFEMWRERQTKISDNPEKSELVPRCMTKTHALVWVPIAKLTSIKRQLSFFCQTICRVPQFEEFLNKYYKPEHIKIVKHFKSKSREKKKRRREVVKLERPAKHVRR